MLLPAGTGALPLEISRGSLGAKMMREVMIALKLTDLGMTLWAAVADGLARQRDAYDAWTAETERRSSDEWFKHWASIGI